MAAFEQNMTMAEFAHKFVAPREIAGELTRDAATRVLWQAAQLAQIDLSWEEIKTFYQHEYERAAEDHSARTLLELAMGGHPPYRCGMPNCRDYLCTPPE